MTERKPMLSVAQALTTLMQTADGFYQGLGESAIEFVPTLTANGRVLARSQQSSLHVPPMDNTQMDGYAVCAADCASGAACLRVSQRIPAGVTGTVLEAGTAARIFTGAFIPEGADAVVMQEQCRIELRVENGVEVSYVHIAHQPQPGEWIRRQGEDITEGVSILAAGTRLRPQETGLAASVGLDSLPVWRRLKVAVFFTGDELTMPGEPLKPGSIYNSNRYLLSGLLQNLGCEVSDFGIVPDSLEATRATLRQAAQEHDVILTSGGVSVGEEDHIRPAVAAEGQINMWQIAVKPGKPLALGEVRREGGGSAFFLGLPGNPVSSFVTFLLFVRPFLLRMHGVDQVAPASFRVRADFELTKADKRNEFLRAKLNQEGGLDLFPNQSSGVLTSTVWGDGLIDVAPGQTIARGEMVAFIPFSSMLY
ncbi:MAG: molybdopterin molybdotransferase MoeA [Burkholderiales bacterium]|nr:molybdopterin molybdotransferase MoeA [Burkholderiales bacterium]